MVTIRWTSADKVVGDFPGAVAESVIHVTDRQYLWGASFVHLARKTTEGGNGGEGIREPHYDGWVP